MTSFFLIFVFLFSPEVFGQAHLSEGILKEYLKIHKEFSSTVCTNNIPDDFQKLTKNYFGDGRYVPTAVDDKLDYGVIGNFLSLLNEKSTWINNQSEFIKSTADFSALLKILDLLNLELESYYQSKNSIHIEKIKSLLDEFKDKAPFLLSFKFPLDHLKLRGDYDRYKNSSASEPRRRANSIYFYRKIVQDGTFDEEMLKTDSGTRAAFDTLYKSIEDKQLKKHALSDNDRVDIIFLINSYTRLLKEGKDKLQARFQEWGLRNNRALIFYQDLLASKKINNELLLRERADALGNLKKFVLANEARAYEFWSKQSELMQALFVIETILYNEVGGSDAPDALERKDVTQLVNNRFENTKYNTLTAADSITPYLVANKININANKWLNILFKEGEFSFTYFYIPANFSIYCPDNSRTGQFYRRENTRIALRLLNQPRKNFKALRYYSRVSMYGRISMDSLWNDFAPLDEVPGKPLKNSKKIKSAFDGQKGLFLYKFINKEMKKTFQVFELNNKKYVVDLDNTKNIYYYRSPHLFRYFAPTK